MATEPHGPGGVALRAWLDANGLNIPTFAQRLHIDRVQLQRLISGERAKRVSRATARLIEIETAGAVPRAVWYPDESEGDESADETDSTEVLHDATSAPDAAVA